MIMHMPWDKNLGGPRVQIELTEALQKRGFVLSKFDMRDAFRSNNWFIRILSPFLFSYKVNNYLKKNCNKFDIIDAHQGNLTASKVELGFSGKLIIRSAGLYHMHIEMLNYLRQNKKGSRFKLSPTSFLVFLLENIFPMGSRVDKSFLNADKIILHNSDELTYARKILRLGYSKTTWIGPGLKSDYLKLLSLNYDKLYYNTKIAFIGSWLPSKGVDDLCKIINAISNNYPTIVFKILGFGIEESTIKKYLIKRHVKLTNVELIRNYENAQLVDLLDGCKIGVSTSYTEGFGIGVLEMLAFGLPVVAYDIPGHRETIGKVASDLLVERANWSKIVQKIEKLIGISEMKYYKLSQNGISLAKKYAVDNTVEQLIEVYNSI